MKVHNKKDLVCMAALRASAGLVLTSQATGPECIPASQFEFISDNGNDTGIAAMDCTQIFELGFREEGPPILPDEDTSQRTVDIQATFRCVDHILKERHNWNHCEVQVRRRIPPFDNRIRCTIFVAFDSNPLVQSGEYLFELDEIGNEKILIR